MVSHGNCSARITHRMKIDGHWEYQIELRLSPEAAGDASDSISTAASNLDRKVRKRYTDFLRLHQGISTRLCAQLVLPPKSRSGLNLRMNFSSSYAMHRQEILQQYLLDVLDNDPQLRCVPVRQFFELLPLVDLYPSPQPSVPRPMHFKQALETIKVSLKKAATVSNEHEQHLIAIANDECKLHSAAVLCAESNFMWSQRFPREISEAARRVKADYKGDAYQELLDFIRNPMLDDAHGD